MTRRDYIALAAAISAAHADAPTGPPQREIWNAALYEVSGRIAAVLERDNPRFDHKRFYAACAASMEPPAA